MNFPERLILFTAAMLLCLSMPGWAGDAAADWQAIVVLDAGPTTQPHTAEEAKAVAVGHLEAQEKAVRAFIAAHPDDPHYFEARVRLVRILRIRGDFVGSETAAAESKQLLAELGRAAKTPEERAEVDFAQVTALMVAIHNPTVEKREELLTAVRKFQTDHPKDRRLAALLAEAASLFDAKPKTKESLLLDAQRLATDDEIKGRVADDLKRLGFLGKEPPIRFNTAGGKAIDLAHYKGKVVFVIFFASWSQPSLMALQTFQKTLENLPPAQFQAIGIDLDEKATSLGAVEKEYHITWPVGFDGKGWESPLVRNLGINTLPTIWLVDTKGVLRSINAVENSATQARLLLDEK